MQHWVSAVVDTNRVTSVTAAVTAEKGNYDFTKVDTTGHGADSASATTVADGSAAPHPSTVATAVPLPGTAITAGATSSSSAITAPAATPAGAEIDGTTLISTSASSVDPSSAGISGIGGGSGGGSGGGGTHGLDHARSRHVTSLSESALPAQRGAGSVVHVACMPLWGHRCRQGLGLLART